MAAVLLDPPLLLETLEVGSVTPFPDDLAPLVAQAQGGDRRALEDLLRASHDHVYPICRRIVGNEADAADAAQEALISVVRGLARFDGRSRFSTWLYRIAVNASVDELRRRRRRPVVQLLRAERTGPGRPAPGASGAGVAALVAPGGPEEGLGMLDIETALMSLPVDFRAAVVLRDVCGLDYAEIAEVLRLPGGTVRSRIARGRALLAGRLGGDGEEGS